MEGQGVAASSASAAGRRGEPGSGAVAAAEFGHSADTNVTSDIKGGGEGWGRNGDDNHVMVTPGHPEASSQDAGTPGRREQRPPRPAPCRPLTPGPRQPLNPNPSSPRQLPSPRHPPTPRQPPIPRQPPNPRQPSPRQASHRPPRPRPASPRRCSSRPRRPSPR